jgi:hypothetical protein
MLVCGLIALSLAAVAVALDEDHFQRARRLVLFAGVLSLLGLAGCSSEEPAIIGPDLGNVAPDCRQVDLAITAQRESTRQEVNFFDSGEIVILTAVPLGRGGPLSGQCDYSRTAAWRLTTTSRSLTCREYGEDAGLQKLVSCISFAGDADLTAFVQHGGHGRSRTFRVVF